MLDRLLSGSELNSDMNEIIKKFHIEGPVDKLCLEKISYYKAFHPEDFLKFEGKIIAVMGLFYKIQKPNSLLEELYKTYSDAIVDETGEEFTPVQASAHRYITNNTYFSFSAPTSSGKSYLFRSLIEEARGDIVIVVPSRALIAEYIKEVREIVRDDTSILVLQFIDDVNVKHTSRRIFVITPERGGELFKYIDRFNIELILLDEAQLSEEKVRGMKFDAFVRRIDHLLPSVKKVFAHPFVANPEAQLIKHNFTVKAQSYNYEQHSVGKIFLSHHKQGFKYFSPNVECLDVEADDVVLETLKENGTLLVHISKAKIYSGDHLIEFGKYVDLCEKVSDFDAIKIIEDLRSFIGASANLREKHSMMIEMMERGIVIHHGSMPLKARLMVEEFIKSGFAKICFATSTLNQGINMPFDVVWIDNYNRMDILTIKNLIGRSGRSKAGKASFDYGYTVVNEKNKTSFKSRYKEEVIISETSELDSDLSLVEEDSRDIVEAIQSGTFDDTLNLTDTQVNRIKESQIDTDVIYILDNFLKDGKPVTAKQYLELGESTRKKIKAAFKNIFVQHLRRKDLTKAELSVISAAIPVMLWHIQGKSFSEIVSLRYAFLSEKDFRQSIRRDIREHKINYEQAQKNLSEKIVRFTPQAAPVPNKTLAQRPLFANGTSILDLDYDTVVYDTYDYLDKVVSLSLTDPVCAALAIFYNRTNDHRAKMLQNYIRYGTNDQSEIWLLRYGYSFEEIELIMPFLISVDSSEIKFSSNIKDASEEIMEIVERYI